MNDEREEPIIAMRNGSVIALSGDKTDTPLRSSGHGVLLYAQDEKDKLKMKRCETCIHAHKWEEPHPYGSTVAHESLMECTLEWDMEEYGEWVDGYGDYEDCPAHREGDGAL